jgi:ABC-2 type transport system permease protein
MATGVSACQLLAHVNPLTYMVDGLRVLMLGIGVSFSGLALDFAVLLVVTTVLVCIGGWLYPRAVM